MGGNMANTDTVVRVDIISDVMCPWCIVGFRQLEQALGHTGMGAQVVWHPFELNPDMPPEGQNLSEHIQQKYGSSPEQSAAARPHLSALGQGLGIYSAYSADIRIRITFQAHQLLDFALSQGKQHPLKLALFAAHFEDGRDVSDPSVLIDVATSVGLDRDNAAQVLETGALEKSVRDKQAFWAERGVSGVPTMIFDAKYMMTGAQGIENYTQVLNRIAQDQAA